MTDQLPLFALHPDRTPTWDDVHEGTARLVDRIEPCDHCENELNPAIEHTVPKPNLQDGIGREVARRG